MPITTRRTVGPPWTSWSSVRNLWVPTRSSSRHLKRLGVSQSAQRVGMNAHRDMCRHPLSIRPCRIRFALDRYSPREPLCTSESYRGMVLHAESSGTILRGSLLRASDRPASPEPHVGLRSRNPSRSSSAQWQTQRKVRMRSSSIAQWASI